VTAAWFPLQVEQGASFALALRVTDAAGTPVSLAGYQARMQVRPEAGYPGDPLADLSTGPGGGITISDDGSTLTVAVAATVTAGYTWEHAVYDLLIQAPDGDVQRLLRGEVTVSAAVTTGAIP
jgi:hypothetical protein